MSLTYEDVRKLFDYRSDGKLIWKVRKGSKGVGAIVGSMCNRNVYSIMQINSEKYRTHRVIWLWYHGYMPEGGLDHINRIKSDNRIENLREVSQQCNMRNVGNGAKNESGVKRVYKHKGWSVWRVQLSKHYIGTFKCFDEAVLHRLAAEQCVNWAGCDSSSPAYQYATKSGLIQWTR